MQQLPTGWTLSAFPDEAGASLDAQIEAARRADLQFVDLRSLDGCNIAVFPLAGAREAKRKLDDAGLAVGMFGSPIGKIDINADFDSDLQKLRHLAELAPLFGCRAVRIFSYYNAQGTPKNDWQSAALDRLGRLRDEATSLDLKLYHENERHIFGDLGDDVLTLAQSLRDGGTFCTIFDFDNFNQSGENVWDTWLKLRDVTDAIHLKDSHEKQHTPVGMGSGQVREILQDAQSRGWNGPLAIEPHLSHSGAVALTGPSGVANQEFGKMKSHESFAVACKAATELLQEVGATVH